MSRIVEYTIVEDTYNLDIDKHINRYLAEGWELYGELKVAGVYGDRGLGAGDEAIFLFAQALVRRLENVPVTSSPKQTKTPKGRKRSR